ncbi:glycoside hydrolase family 65 protein [Streptomyces lydicus]|uniref:glycoside hydrolase family 65 protein n=1 Tax=Streptomyces lydicus TaxID=47763 RepID=UPI000524DD90|nr:glycosyl hydrolase family 65 protein [Streptomyces lydicus]MDC7340503.1 glycosyl hydrolase family 65 protein [Streptomyces lydicus]UEG89813.1 glycoside hydrolase family 65 protein [Streptomyces lydicus]
MPTAGTRAWTWTYEGYDADAERLRETLCALGNGYFVTRGAACEVLSGPAHYPGTYAAGCYNRLTSTVAGRLVENEDMVNLPNWLPLRYRILPSDAEPGPWLHPGHAHMTAHRQTLDLRHGTLSRLSVYEDEAGRRLTVEQRRLVHMGEPHLALQRTSFTAEGWVGEVEVESCLDGAVRNTGVARYRGLADQHLRGWETGTEGADTVWLSCRTVDSDIRIALAERIRATPGRGVTPRPRLTVLRAAHALTLPLAPGATAVVDKTVALYTSRDPAIESPRHAAVDCVVQAAHFRQLLASHRRAWENLWRQAKLEVPGDAGRILRLHLFHVLQTLSPHTAELDVGVPARGLHGEAYRGHVFWDELFVLPFLNLHLPQVSRALLTYRYRRLPAACHAAEQAGRAGAMYPWQSAGDGREETQELHLNPRSGRWLPDFSRLQHHVGSAIAYNVWQYGQASGDTEFLHTRGAEMLLQIARFWASAALWDPVLGRYRIRGVVGPDEYHDGYPGAAEPGVDDNAYTNVTAAWVLVRALELCRTLPEAHRRQLYERIELTPDEPERWEDISRLLHVPYHQGVISQFAGYRDLAELDWDGYRQRYGDIRRLDRILEAEGDTVNHYQASKQADVLMLGYLFSPAELASVFRRLGCPLDDDIWHSTVDYYLRRTSHGSTLSALVHAWVLARVHRPDAWTYCEEALTGDVADVQGGTTAEGIHLGAMAGTLDLVQRGLTGLETRDRTLWLDPAPLPQLSKFAVRIRFRQHWDIDLRIHAEQVRIAVPESENEAVRVRLRERSFGIAPGTTRRLDLPDA